MLTRLAKYLIERARRTPYFPILSPDGKEVYMDRHWLFNPYRQTETGATVARFPRLPSARVHHIMVADGDRHLHDHPWNAVSVILSGWYMEEREGGKVHMREAGDIVHLKHGQFHRIIGVSPGGVHTLFITGKYRGTWGFKIPWREYLQQRQDLDNIKLRDANNEQEN